MPEFVVKTERTVRWEGKFCGCDGKDCEYQDILDGMGENECAFFSTDEGSVILEPHVGEDENEDCLERCKSCIDQFGE